MEQLKIGQILQTRRETLSLTQGDLAEMTGITSKTIYLVEVGKGNPSLQTLQKIMDVLGLEMSIDVKTTYE